jgi:hypothetical protein
MGANVLVGLNSQSIYQILYLKIHDKIFFKATNSGNRFDTQTFNGDDTKVSYWI